MAFKRPEKAVVTILILVETPLQHFIEEREHVQWLPSQSLF